MATERSHTTEEYSVYVPDRDDAEPFPIDVDDGVQIDLIEATGVEEMRARMWFLQPGDSVSFHYHDEQEELFYVVSGTGHLVIGEDRELVEVPEGGMVRPETTTPRQLRNESDDEVVWLIVGAPPVVEARLWTEYDADGAPADEGEFRPLEEWF